MYTIRQRDVPEQLVLTEQRHVKAGDLPDWIRAAGGRLTTAAAKHGGITGPAFIVYHGPVSADSESLVEVCVPISAEKNGATDTAMRHEAAHREAYVRITKAQVVFPQIQQVYRAIAEDLESKGIETTDSPREVYFKDFYAAKPTDEVCDVAFPIR
jgi:effector-binding domain-containing protein